MMNISGLVEFSVNEETYDMGYGDMMTEKKCIARILTTVYGHVYAWDARIIFPDSTLDPLGNRKSYLMDVEKAEIYINPEYDTPFIAVYKIKNIKEKRGG